MLDPYSLALPPDRKTKFGPISCPGTSAKPLGNLFNKYVEL